MRDSTDVTQSDLGTEEDLEMLLNTFSGYDMEIADLSQLGANAERARTTSCLTSRSPGPAKLRDAKFNSIQFKFKFKRGLRLQCEEARTTSLFTEMIAEERNAGDRCDGKGKDQGVRWTGCWISSTSRSHIC